MSEQMSIVGKCQFHHLPMPEKGGFAYCHRCKKVKNSLIINLNEGFMTRRISAVCPSCKKTIWTHTIEFSFEAKDNKKLWVIPKDDKKCCICGGLTNDYGICCCQGKRDKYVCNKSKCLIEFSRRELQGIKKRKNKRT